MDSNTILCCHILQLQHEIAMGKVADLPAPAAAHTLENQVLEEDGVIPAAKIMGQLPLEVAPLVVDALMEPVKLQPLAIPVVGTGRTPREIATPAAQLQKSALEVQGIFNHHTVAQRHICLQAEVDAYGCTIVCLSDRLRDFVEHHDDEIFPKAVALDGERLHLSIVGTAQRELEAFPDAVHGQDIPVQGIAALLEDNGREIPDTAKLRGTLCQASEKTLVAGVETLQYLLHSLGVKQLPVNAVRKVCLHALAVDKPPVHAVVPALKRKGVIPHKASLAEHRVKMPRAPVEV